jgi:hypothetical protein
MNQPPQKLCIQGRIKAWISRRRPQSYDLVLIVSLFIAVYFLIFYGRETFVDFLVSFSAGILGIVAGFTLERRREQTKDDQTKKDFLNLMRNELTEIKGKIPPQTKIPLMLYPEVWDSFVSSGLLRLLSAEQVTKLSSVYRFIKGFQYEAEWVRRVVEEYESIPDTMRAEKETSNRRYRLLQDAYERHGIQLSQAIEKILGEKWLEPK